MLRTQRLNIGVISAIPACRQAGLRELLTTSHCSILNFFYRIHINPDKMKAIILGSTGMIGKGVLLECLEDSAVTNILVINRHSCGITNAKLKEIIHDDFFNFSGLKEQISGYDTCFFCLGISSVGLDEKKYTRITYDLTLGFAHLMVDLNPHAVFCYVSGVGTDSSEKGRIMWARVKGKTENELLALPFKASYMFRPGYIQPMKGIKSRTKLYALFYLFLTPVYYLLRPFHSTVTDTVSVGRAMINIALMGYDKRIITSKDMYILAQN
jgi:hypothetical protein